MRKYILVEFESGNSALLVQTSENVIQSVWVQGDAVTKQTELAMDHQSFSSLQHQAVTHHLHFDDASQQVVAKPKQQPPGQPPAA